MKFGKVFSVFKKGSKAASKRKGKGAAAAGGFEWPSGVRIGLYGHDNSGKTVYFTVLNEECKVSKDLQISVTDGATAGEFLANYRRIWGVGTKTDIGTVVDLREEKKFPDSTKGDKVLQFNAILDRKKKIPVVTYDYDGQAVSISGQHELSEKVIDFMSGCNGVLFFYDPKMLGSEARTQAHAASFVNFLERLAPLNRRLPIPVALVVTKADILPGFSSESQTVLISAEDERFFAEDYEVFLDRVLTSNKIASNSTWAGAVRDILVKLKEFLKVVVGRTLDFQIFFVSSTGEEPEKIGTDVGRSIYKPPSKMHPVGIREPYYWILKAIRRSRRVSRIRTLAKYVAILSLIWVGVFSLPHLYHFQYLLPRATNVEDNVLGSRRRSSATQEDRKTIRGAYARYRGAWTVRGFFPKFLVPTEKIRSIYDKDMLKVELNRLEEAIKRLTAVVQNADLWPTVDHTTNSLRLVPKVEELEATLNEFHQNDSASELFTRSGRVLNLWDLFKSVLLLPSDSAWINVERHVENDRSFHGKSLSAAEIGMGEALTEAASARQQIVEETQTVQKASDKFEELVAKIKGRPGDYEYLLGTTVINELKELKGNLAGDPTRQEDVQRIKSYLAQANNFIKKRQPYTFTLTSCPEDHHVHIHVKKGGKTGEWEEGQQLFPGDQFTITWQAGDHIVIALDEKHVGQHKESWGKKSTDKVELKKRLAIFDLDGTVAFPLGAAIGVSSEKDLKAMLPRF